jgi:hypothetical protein
MRFGWFLSYLRIPFRLLVLYKRSTWWELDHKWYVSSNLEEYCSWRVLMYYPSIIMGRLMKTTQELSKIAGNTAEIRTGNLCESKVLTSCQDSGSSVRGIMTLQCIMASSAQLGSRFRYPYGAQVCLVLWGVLCCVSRNIDIDWSSNLVLPIWRTCFVKINIESGYRYVVAEEVKLSST